MATEHEHETEAEQWKRHCKRAEEQLAAMRVAFDGATPAELRRLRAMETRFDRVIAVVDEYRADGRVVSGAESFDRVVAAVDGYRDDGGGKYARGDYSKPAGGGQ